MSQNLSLHDPEGILEPAYQYMKKWFVTRKEFNESVEMIDYINTDMARARYLVEEREFIEKVVPSTSDKLPIQNQVFPNEYDPWSVNPSDIATKTRRVILCKSCNGEQKVTCPKCKGTMQAKCFGCNGSGRVPAKRGGLKNCPNCRGKGTRKCENCKKGFVDCRPCNATGRQEHWLEIKQGKLQFTLYKVPEKQKKFDWPTFEQVEARDPLLPFDILIAWTGDAIENSPSEAQEWLNQPELIPGTNERTMRIKNIEVQAVRLPMAMVQYQFAGKKGGLFIKSKDMLVLPDASDKQPLQIRLAYLAAGAILSLFIGGQIASGYSAKHPFFSQTWVSGMMSLIPWAMAGISLPLTSKLCLPNNSELRASWKKFAGALALVLFLQMFLPTLGQPSVKHANHLLSQGQEEAGLRELDAAIKTKRNESDATNAYDHYYLSKAKEQNSIQSISPFLSTAFYLPESRVKVLSHLQKVAEREILPPRDSQSYLKALSELPAEVFQQSDPIKTAAWNELDKSTQNCMKKNDLSCLKTNLLLLDNWSAPPEVRKKAKDKVSGYFQNHLKVTWSPALQANHYPVREKTCQTVSQILASAPAQLQSESFIKQASYAKTCQSWKTEETERQKQIAKAAAERKAYEEKIAKQRAEAEAAQKEAEEERQRMRDLYPNGALMCNDGSFSPTCSCPGGRGCCSHHGGVAGCKYY